MCRVIFETGKQGFRSSWARGSTTFKLGAGLDDLHVKCERTEKALSRGTHGDVLAAMADLRRTVDRLELLVDDGKWPLPKYREMLFVY